MNKISDNFSREEFACKCGCGFNTVDVELVKVLEDIRKYFGKPIHINSGCRCVTHNKAEGGGPTSKHLQGIAADIVVKDINETIVADYLEALYPDKYGIGRYVGRTHIDVREQKARWSK